jgi:hypothetical protein
MGGPTATDVQTGLDAVLAHFEKQKRTKDVSTLIQEAQTKGYQVEYSIDPATGLITPKITSPKVDPYAEVMKQAISGQGGQGGQWQVNSIGSGGPRIAPKTKPYKPEDIDAAEYLAQTAGRVKGNIGNSFNTIKLKKGSMGVEQTFDVKTPQGRRDAIAFQFGPDWETNPDLANLKTILEAREGEDATLATAAEAATKKPDARVQPLTESGVKAAVSKNAAQYKEAIAFYEKETPGQGKAMAEKIVNRIIELQKQGMPLTKIAEYMKAQKINPDLFLKQYMK